jgi:hypothetical protein
LDPGRTKRAVEERQGVLRAFYVEPEALEGSRSSLGYYLVRGGGIEPKISVERSTHSEGQNLHQDRQNQGLAPKNMTEPDRTGTQPEPPNDHNRHITGYITDSELTSVVDAWPDLSPEARQMIAGIVESAKKEKS